MLLLQRADNGLWTIPTGGLKKDETIRGCAVRECREETGIEITDLGGVFTTPDHVIECIKGGKVTEVRRPVSISCTPARTAGGSPSPTRPPPCAGSLRKTLPNTTPIRRCAAASTTA